MSASPSPRTMGFLAVASALALSGLAAAFGHEGGLPPAGPEDREARTLHVLQYHPYPDPQGDPWGLPGGARNGSHVGYMEAAYGAYWYPTAVFDGLNEGATKVEGATTFLETFNALEQVYLKRRQVDAPLRISLGASWAPDRAAVEADLFAKRPIETDNVTLRIVLFEDEVAFDGGNGITVHRFTVRAVAYDGPVALAANGTANRQAMVLLNETWNRDRLGFVASVHNRDVNSLEFKPGEVLQAATWRAGQDGPTIQWTRGVLLEVMTATWCKACLYGDNAVDELANEYGFASSRYLARDWAYYRQPAANALAVAATLAMAGAFVAWRLHRAGGTGP